jgi:hypothetical protein
MFWATFWATFFTNSSGHPDGYETNPAVGRISCIVVDMALLKAETKDE